MAVKALTLAACATVLFASPCSHSEEGGLQPLDAVQRAAQRAVRREIDPALKGVQLDVVPLDPRLRLPACGGELDSRAQPPRGTQTRVLARVTCTRGVTWSLNVPVDVRREITLLVLRRAIARGETIGAADVSAQTRILAGLGSPYVARVEDLAGRPTRRPLPEGTAITADALNAALLIHRGQDVTLMTSAGGLEVRAPGRALADASANQRLRVQNSGSLKIVEGVAETDTVVRVTP
ncbi:MAG TPA: flagellar basal body P-ring formation chaperone FlgA [Steroidobacteraceae bacterium]|jgi:flagellar basal body P-ring formation protein FlgA|nr:flagellar basal body P-ring formation chaperone FlgA [Steroidobacteraceae bacterium]